MNQGFLYLKINGSRKKKSLKNKSFVVYSKGGAWGKFWLGLKNGIANYEHVYFILHVIESGCNCT